MGGRPTDWHIVGRGADPTPGDHEVLREWERYFRSRSEDAHDKMLKLRNIQSNAHTIELEGSWITAIWGRCDYLAQQLTPEWSCHQEAADALKAFIRQLPDLQQNADYGLKMARTALADHDHASGKLAVMAAQSAKRDSAAGFCAPATPEEVNERRSWQGRMDQANSSLKIAKGLVDTAAADFHTAVTQVVIALNNSEQVLGNGVFNPAPADRDTTGPKRPSLTHRAVDTLMGDFYALAAVTAGTLKGADSIGMNVETMMMLGPEVGGPGGDFAFTDGTTSTGLADSYAFGTDPFGGYEAADGQLDDPWLTRDWRTYDNRYRRGGPKPPQVRVADLSEEESYDGHTIERHVGKTDQFLRNRIKEEDLDSASTYNSYSEAEEYTNNVAVSKKPEIEAWLKSGKSKKAFTAQFDGAQIGKRITRDEIVAGVDPHPVDAATIVLKRDSSAPDGYYVLTSFPGPAD